MIRVALVVSYEGTEFSGWQHQERFRTVQGVLERTLARPCAGPVRVHGAGRTDAGVSALAQVAHADVPDRWHGGAAADLRYRTGVLLPRDLNLRAVTEMPEDFDARKSATGKVYRYQLDVATVPSMLSRRFRHHVRQELDVSAMAEAARLFEGERDFASLQSTGSSVKTSVREISSCRIEGTSPFVDLVVEGSGFLRHMVRTLVGSLLLVGRGKRPVSWIPEMLAACDRAAAGPKAPATGLLLQQVNYTSPHAERIRAALDAQSHFFRSRSTR